MRVTACWRAGKLWGMKISRCWFVVLGFGVLAGGNLAGQISGPVAGVEMSDGEFQALSEKTNLYVKVINSLSRVKQSYDRYISWVDVKKGPTGKERYITYSLYELNRSDVETVQATAKKGPGLPPPIPAADAAVQKLGAVLGELEPLVKKAHDYYDQQDFKDDGAKRGQELHAQMMPLFTSAFAAEVELRRALEPVKALVDRRALAQIEKKVGKNYEWHLRSYMLAAKSVVDLLPDSATAPTIDATTYKARYEALESAYNAFDTFSSQHPEDVKKVLMASFVESGVKEFFTAAKFLRRVLEAPKLDKSEYVKQVNVMVEKYNALIQRTNSLR